MGKKEKGGGEGSLDKPGGGGAKKICGNTGDHRTGSRGKGDMSHKTERKGKGPQGKWVSA